MGFKLSKRSLKKLEGVDEGLASVVRYAIGVTSVDFGCICGLRTIEEQRLLVKKGASQTMKSKHLDGMAVDLMAYVGSRASWELNLYDEIADAMKEGADACGVPIKWGAAWSVQNIMEWKGDEYTFYSDVDQAERTIVYPPTMEGAMNSYIDLRRRQEQRPFIDGPHFERSA